MASGLYWGFSLLFCGPMAGFFCLFNAAFNAALYLVGLGSKGRFIEVDPASEEFAVVITGCDTGFGYELAVKLAERDGFRIFAGCLEPEQSFPRFQGKARITPIKLDVTKQEDVEASFKVVTLWLAQDDGKKRCLHGLVNNAGISGSFGLIDWLSTDENRACMEVNYFGAVRMVKSFLGLFKEQAVSLNEKKHHEGARIINISSTAGMVPVPMAAAYAASKHALDVFSVTLGMELQDFGIRVITINPAAHKTPIATSIVGSLQRTIDRLDPAVREQYGEKYCNFGPAFFSIMMPPLTWDSRVMIKHLLAALDLADPPARMLVGMDAKYIHPVMKMLPWWLSGPLTVPTAGVPKARTAFLLADKRNKKSFKKQD